jgi:hypothetical protein
MHPFKIAILSQLLVIAACCQNVSNPYSWTPLNPALTTSRADSCAFSLPDGTALFSGGVGVDGKALASVESFQQTAGFTAAAPMNAARSAHTCSTLQDGRVLVVGGTDGQGLPVATAEIYDRATQSWTFAATLNDPRWGHTATVLNDGRVLIAGGQDFYGPKDTLEIFDPLQGAFFPLDDRLSTPRMNHAAVLLPDGLVAILGGSNGANSISSVDLFIPGEAGLFDDLIIAAAPMQAARASLTANNLPDGTILVAGGFDGQQDLDTAEVYDLHKGSFLTLGKLNTARHGHLALVLPGNGAIVIIGGSSGGSTLDSCELYDPEQGAFTPIGSLTSPRARTSAAAIDGGVVSAGGISTDGVTPVASSGFLATPTVAFTLDGGFSDPFSGRLTITGKNFGAGQSVTLQLTVKNNQSNTTRTLNTAFPTSANGSFSFAASPREPSGTWTVTAATKASPVLKASASQNLVFTTVNLTSSCNPCTVGQSVQLTATLINPRTSAFTVGSPASQTVTFFDGGVAIGTAPIVPSGSTFGPGATIGTVKAMVLKPSPAGNRVFTASIAQSTGYVGASTPLTVALDPIPTTLLAFANPNPVASGKSSVLTANLGMDTALAAALGVSPTGTIMYQADGTTFANPPIGSPISVTPPPLSNALQAPHTITATYSGDGNYAPSSITTTLTVSEVSLPAIPFFGVVTFAAPPSLAWAIHPITGQVPEFAFLFGETDDIPLIGDWTGAGTSSAGVFDPRSDTWTLGGPVAKTVDITASFRFGRADCSMMLPAGPDLFPVAGDWTGTGHTGIGVYDSTSGIWCLRNTASAGPPDAQFQFTLQNAIPVVGDWDGNGTTTVGLFDLGLSIWFLRNENSSGAPDAGMITFGSGLIVADVPLPGNWLTTDPRKTFLGIVEVPFSPGQVSLSTLENNTTQSFQLGNGNAPPLDINQVVRAVSGVMCFLCTP